MALTDGENGMVMPVTPMYGNNNGGFGFGGDWGWIVLLLLLVGGGWGNGFGGGYGGFNGALGYDFPWLLNGQNGINNNVNDGFRDAQLHDSVTSVRDGISALATQLCGCCGDMQMGMANGFAGVQQTLANGFAGTNSAIASAQNGITQQLYGNEIASLNRSFAEQTANAQGFNAVNAGIADTRYTIAAEACNTRNTDTQNTQAIITAVTAGVQSIKDQLCQDKIDAKNDEIAQLRQENLYARGQASQVAQNSAIINGVYDRLNQCPVGTVPVYGEQPIFTCNNNTNFGCGCGNGF